MVWAPMIAVAPSSESTSNVWIVVKKVRVAMCVVVEFSCRRRQATALPGAQAAVAVEARLEFDRDPAWCCGDELGPSSGEDDYRLRTMSCGS